MRTAKDLSGLRGDDLSDKWDHVRPSDPGSVRQGPGRSRDAGLPRPEAVRDRMDEHLVTLLAPDSFEAEHYRSLALALSGPRAGRDFSVLAVTSARPGEGKTTTAINLAAVFSEAEGSRVLLVDGDLRRPAVATQLALDEPSRPGFADVLRNPALGLELAVRSRPPLGFSVLPAGRSPEGAYRLLNSARLGLVLQEARRRFDRIVVDTPPALPVPDCRWMGECVDGFLLVVAANETPRKLVEDSLNLLDPDKMVGIVFNRDDRPFSGYGRYYSSYYVRPRS